jgi:predicted MPP superfamily phosphohydrolase
MSNGAFRMFSIVLLLVIGLIQYLFYRKITRHIRTMSNSSAYLLLTRIVFVLFFLPVAGIVIWQPKLGKSLDWVILFGVFPLYLWHFSWIMLFLVLMIGKLFQLPFRLTAFIMKKFERPRTWLSTPKVQNFDARRRVFLRRGITILAGASFTGSAIGAIRRNEFEINHIEIPIKSLAEEHNGFTICLLSDIHSSVFMTKETMLRYARAANALKTDVIAVVGDFVNSQVEEVYPFAEAFSELKAPYGVYGVLGNHDYYSRDVDTVAKHVDECGIRLLVNSQLTIEKNNKKLHLLGADDTGNTVKAGRSFDAMLKRVDVENTKILLCHRPYFFQQAADRNIDLTLSGHTHGGQIVFARVGNEIVSFARVASPYVAGLYTINSSHMYVSRGIGTVGVPVRINCPPEITKITLVKA